MSKGNPSSGRVNQSQGGSWKVFGSRCGGKWGGSQSFDWGVSMSRAVSMPSLSSISLWTLGIVRRPLPDFPILTPQEVPKNQSYLIVKESEL